MKQAILRLMDGVYLFSMWTAGLSILFMSLIIPWGVFARYVLGSGSRWPEPIAILLMVMFTFFGAAVAYRAGAHIAVALVTQRLPPGVRRAVEVVIDLLMVVVSIFMLIWGGKLALETMGQEVAELPGLAVGITYLPLPLGGLVTLLFVLERMAFGSQHERDVIRFDQSLDQSAGEV
jgi:TRAP-type C4-dicarboxylate transport system permease small subunit